VLRIALARDRPCGLPWTPETSAAPGVRKSGQAQGLPLARRAAREPALAGGCATRTPGNKVNWRSINKEGGKNYTNPGLGTGPVTSSQQSHLAKLRHTEPGVHETRDAPLRACSRVLLAGSNLALSLRSQVGGGGGYCLLMVVRGHLGDTSATSS
jgi:hypothetical protein